MNNTSYDENKEGTWLARGGAGAVTVIWFLICAVAITLLLSS